jgi:four helix bundle protein
MSDYRNLVVWKDSVDLAVDVFRLVDRLSHDLRITVGDQIRRSALSIPSNLAEGTGRSSRREMIRFARYSIGSLYELETQLVILGRLDRASPGAIELLERADTLAKQLSALVRTLTSRS